MARNFEKLAIKNAQAKNVEFSSCDKINSWIGKWEEVTGRTRDKCSFKGCNNTAEVGGHLWIENKSDDYNYIAPICYSCNNSSIRNHL